MDRYPGGPKLSAADLLSNGPRVVNVGLPRFAEDLRAAGVPMADAAWTPPASADTRALDALEQALYERSVDPRDGLVHPGGRGSQYLCIRYTERLAEAGIEQSVSSVGDSYDCEHDVQRRSV